MDARTRANPSRTGASSIATRLQMLRRAILLGFLAGIALVGLESAQQGSPPVPSLPGPARGQKQHGLASWYSHASTLAEGNSGVMANGKTIQDEAFTAASWDYPLNSKILVSTSTGQSATVVITDRGPNLRLYRKGRILDLSKAAFQALAPLSQGVIEVTIEPM